MRALLGLIVLAVASTSTTARDDVKNQADELRKQIATKKAELAKLEAELSKVEPSTLPDKEAVAKLVSQFSTTPTAERGQFVLDADIFKDYHAAHYRAALVPKQATVTINSLTLDSKANRVIADASMQYTAGDGRSQALSRVFILQNSTDGLRIDWGATCGYNPVGFKTWSVGEDASVTLRLTSQIDDYYNYGFKNAKDTHYSIKLDERFGDRAAGFHGYIPKDSVVGKKIYQLLKDGQRREITLTIRRTGKESSIVEITELVSDSWAK